jgi:hypothetical protein
VTAQRGRFIRDHVQLSRQSQHICHDRFCHPAHALSIRRIHKPAIAGTVLIRAQSPPSSVKKEHQINVHDSGVWR